MANAKKCDICGMFYDNHDDTYETYILNKEEDKNVKIKLPIRPVMWDDPADLCLECLHTVLTSIVKGIGNKLT